MQMQTHWSCSSDSESIVEFSGSDALEDYDRSPPSPSEAMITFDEEFDLDNVLESLTAPPMEKSRFLTPSTLMGMNLVAMYRSLPILLGAIESIGRRSRANKGQFVRLLRVLRARICSCRIFKLRFLTLISANEHLKDFWDVKTVYESKCYEKQNTGFDMFSIDSKDLEEMDSFSNLTDFVPDYSEDSPLSDPDAQCSFFQDRWNWDAKQWKQILLTNPTVLRFVAITEMLHPERGIRLKERVHRLRKVKDTFRAYEAVDWLISRIGLQNQERHVAVELLENLHKSGIIKSLGFKKHPVFADCKDLWMSNVNTVSENRCAFVRTLSGEKVSCFKQAEQLPDTDLINQVEFIVPVDDIDMQALHFWKNDVYTNTSEAKQGDQIGFRHIVHPLVPSDDSERKDSCLYRSGRKESFSSSTESSDQESKESETEIAFVGKVEKVFSSIARPFILSLHAPTEGAFLGLENYKKLGGNVLVKTGDNLMQDYLCQTMFRLFNMMWKKSGMFKQFEEPFICTYEVFPTAEKKGFLEAVENVQSLKDFNWNAWKQKYQDDKNTQKRLLLSAAGSYVGAYVLGVRDRHWDNILIQNESTLFHIDFGFILGQVPPIDAPRFSVSPGMQEAFRELQIWDEFVDTCCSAFKVLYQESGRILRASEMILPFGGFEKHVFTKFINGPFSLNIHENEELCISNIRSQISGSAKAWQTKLKSVFHNNIDPVFYSLLEKEFPPAVLAMKLVDSKRSNDQKSRSYSMLRAQRKESMSSLNNSVSTGIWIQS